jgi:hypothetical protein
MTCSIISCKQVACYPGHRDWPALCLDHFIPEYCNVDTCFEFVQQPKNGKRPELCVYHANSLCSFSGCLSTFVHKRNQKCLHHSQEKCARCGISEQDTLLIEYCDKCTTHYISKEICFTCKIPLSLVAFGKYYLKCSSTVCTNNNKTIDCYPINWPS